MHKIGVISIVSILGLLYSIESTADHRQELAYIKKISVTNEWSDGYNSEDIVKKIMSRPINSFAIDNSTEFGVHGMERPYIHADRNFDKTDRAFELLSRTGVDSLRSTEAAWHRLSDKNGKLTNFSELDFQLSEAKKYGMSNLFVVGYPPAKYSVSGNKLSAVSPKYYNLYEQYYNTLIKHFSGYDVQYLELGNEVDAGKVWWINSTPKQYVEEMCFLHSILSKKKSRIKTVAFAATYSREANLGKEYGGGRLFLKSSLEQGIDSCADYYSLHHFSMVSPNSFPDYMHKLLSGHNIHKKLLDTEQLDTSTLDKDDTQPYTLIKIFTRGFFLFDLKRIDYYMAKDYLLGNKFYTMGLFDINLNPKPRMLAYAASVDALKNRELISLNAPLPGVEAYILSNKNIANSKFKYTVVLWSNTKEIRNVDGFNGDIVIESWNLDTRVIKNNSSALPIGQEPVIVYCDHMPNWPILSKKQILNYKNISNELPMP